MNLLKYVAYLIIFFSWTAFAQPGPINNVFEIGGAINGSYSAIKPIDTSTFTLQANVISSSSDTYLLLTQMSAGAANGQYQVSAGKTAVCYGMQMSTNTSNTNFFLGYGTSALIANNTPTAPLVSVQYNSQTGASTFYTSASVSAPDFYPVVIQFPASSYPYVFLVTASSFFLKMQCAEY